MRRIIYDMSHWQRGGKQAERCEAAVSLDASYCVLLRLTWEKVLLFRDRYRQNAPEHPFFDDVSR